MSAPHRPPSEWALSHAKQVLDWPKNRLEKSQAFALTLDFNELRELAGKVMGTECIAVEKVEEGQKLSYDLPINLSAIITQTYRWHEPMAQLYLLTFVNGAEAIARISFPKRFPIDRVASEVATLQYVQEHTSVPAPKVFFSCADPHNTVGAPFTIQERIRGQPLYAVWQTMSNKQQETLITNLAALEAKLLSAQFEGIGSLARDSTGVFKVGPLVPFNADWNTDDPERGPWPSCQSYISALAGRELRWLEDKPHQFREKHQSQWGHDHNIDIDQLKDIYRLVQKLSTRLPFFEPSASRSGLFHVDLSSDNVLVDLTDVCRVAAIVDWDFAKVVPLWAYTREWDFLRGYEDDEPAAKSHSAALRKLRKDIIMEQVPGVRIAIDEGKHFQLLDYLASWPSWCFETIGQARDLVENLRDIWPVDDPGYQWIVAYLS